MKTAEIALIDRLRQRKQLPGHIQETVNAIAEKTVFVIDHSGSMSSRDYPPNRLKAAVQAVENYVAVKNDAAPADLAGAVIFNSRAEVICHDCRMIDADRSFIRALKKTSASNGTDIAAGLEAAGALLGASSSLLRNRIVLLTDGHGGRPEKTAERIKEMGVVIDVIGIGGSPNQVNEKSLKKVASILDGQLRYRFIGDKEILVEHFREIANALVRVR